MLQNTFIFTARAFANVYFHVTYTWIKTLVVSQLNRSPNSDSDLCFLVHPWVAAETSVFPLHP